MKRILIVGYGNQGRAWALNLRDSGWLAEVLLREKSKGLAQAQTDGFIAHTNAEVLHLFDLVALLIPDEEVPGFFSLHEKLVRGKKMLFAHGFSIHFGTIAWKGSITPLLVAPKAIGEALRAHYETGEGVYGLIGAVEKFEVHEKFLQDFAADLGLRKGVVPTTFSEETLSDLFSEQVLLCGAIPKLVLQCFETLVKNGMDRRIAYFECLKEVKLIADVLDRHGMAGLFSRISTTAALGGVNAGDFLVDDMAAEKIDGIYESLVNGEFFRFYTTQKNQGFPLVKARIAELNSHPIEAVRAELEENV